MYASPTRTRQRAVIGGLLASLTAAALLVAGSPPASAHSVEPAVLSKVRVSCLDGGPGIVAKLRNPNKTAMDYMVAFSGGDYAESYVVSPAAHSSVPVEFGGMSNGTYTLIVWNAAGDVIAAASVDVNC